MLPEADRDKACDRLCDAAQGVLEVGQAGDWLSRIGTALRRLEVALRDYQDACDLDAVPPTQLARIRGSVCWDVGAGRN